MGWDHLRKVGGILVYVCGQEVLHGCGVEHDGAGFFSFWRAGGGALREVDKWRDFLEMEAVDLDAGY